MPRPPIPAPPYAGGCLCGAARYALNARPRATNACHCTDCKKLSGATHIHMILADRDALKHEQGELTRWRKRADSGRDVDIVRCAACGTRLWHEPVASPHLVFLAAGTLDDPSWFRPATHIWTARAEDGTVFTPDADMHEGQPPTREMLMEAFEKLYPSD